jgi:hypothetical protein
MPCHDSDCASLKKEIVAGAVGDSMKIGSEVEGEVTCASAAAEDLHGELSGVEYPDEVLEQCSECGENVPVWLVGEHTDHHLAVRLQHKEQLIVKPTVNDVRTPRTRPSTSLRMKTLHTFFNK